MAGAVMAAVVAAVDGSGAHDGPAGCNWQRVCGRPEQRRGQRLDVCRGVAGVHTRPGVDSSDNHYSNCMDTELGEVDNTKRDAYCSPVAVRSPEGRYELRSGDVGSRPGTGCECRSAGLPNGEPGHGAGDVGRNSHKKQDRHSDPQKTLDKAHSNQIHTVLPLLQTSLSFFFTI